MTAINFLNIHYLCKRIRIRYITLVQIRIKLLEFLHCCFFTNFYLFNSKNIKINFLKEYIRFQKIGTRVGTTFFINIWAITDQDDQKIL